MSRALKARASRGIGLETPVNPIDFSLSLGVEVHFVDAPSMEGLFLRNPAPNIFLPSTQHRPQFRIAYSCSHELGHFELGHLMAVHRVGETVDYSNEDESAADCFASWLLMPRQTVVEGLQVRGMTSDSMSVIDILCMTNEMCVSLDAFGVHLNRLELINSRVQREIKTISPAEIIKKTIGPNFYHAVSLFVDKHWRRKTIDVEVGSSLFVIDSHFSTSADVSVTEIQNPVARKRITVVIPNRCGEFRCQLGGQELSLRVASPYFVGLARYRYLPPAEDD